MHFFDSIIIGIYVITLIYIGFNRTKKSRSSPEEYLLMGRRLSLPGFVASLVATWYGGILGLGENTYLYGIQTWCILAMPYYVFLNHKEETLVENANYQDYRTIELFKDWLNRGLKEFSK